MSDKADTSEKVEKNRRNFMMAGLAVASASVLLDVPFAEATTSPNEYYNLLDSGMDLTGATDVTSEFQQILNTYPYIWIPAGAILLVSAQLNLTLPRQVIFGPGLAQVKGASDNYTDEAPKIVNTTTTTNILYQSVASSKIALKGFNIVANSPEVTCVYLDRKNQDVILQDIAVSGTFSRGFYIGGSENLQIKNINAKSANLYDTMLDIAGVNAAQIDSIVTSNVVPDASIVTSTVRVCNHGSPYVGSITFTNTTCQGTTIGLDLQWAASIVVNNLYCEQVVLPMRVGWVPTAIESRNIGSIVSLIVNGGILGGASSTHLQYASYVTDIYVKQAFNAVFTACNHNGSASTAICFDDVSSLRVISPYKNSGVIRDFIGHGLIAHSQSNKNTAASIVCDMDFDGTSYALNADGSLGTSPGMSMGSYKTFKAAGTSDIPSYGWRHYRKYIDNTGADVNELWVPPLQNLPSLYL